MGDHMQQDLRPDDIRILKIVDEIQSCGFIPDWIAVHKDFFDKTPSHINGVKIITSPLVENGKIYYGQSCK